MACTGHVQYRPSMDLQCIYMTRILKKSNKFFKNSSCYDQTSCAIPKTVDFLNKDS